MSLTIGTQLGSHEITALLGKGGMGEVYRARDTKLKREVAIKILPDEFSRDPERVARFQREAEVLASLNHPNIAAIYDLAEADGSRFLVIELVEGQTLADRIRRGAIPIDEALSIAKSICEALEAAHEKGIVHRDLKPANIKLTPDNKVKVLDFGLAKVRAAQAAADFSNSPTLFSGSTPGVILGTAAYMSPQQAKGKETDRTTDIWAFGCVLFEMLSKHPVFEGETLTEILAGVMKGEPACHRLPAETPEGIRRLLRRCLQKEQKLRLHDMADAWIEIDECTLQPYSKSPNLNRLPWILVAALFVVSLVLFVMYVGQKPVPTPPARVSILSPEGSALTSQLALSPDGQYLAFVATSADGKDSLWVRRFDTLAAQQLPRTDNAQFPFWSPDNRFIGFFAQGKLKKIALSGGPPENITDVADGRGGTWNRDGIILFATGNAIFRVSAFGGTPTTLITPDEKSANELLRGQGHRLLLTVIAIILPMKTHTLIFDVEQAVLEIATRLV